GHQCGITFACGTACAGVASIARRGGRPCYRRSPPLLTGGLPVGAVLVGIAFVGTVLASIAFAGALQANDCRRHHPYPWALPLRASGSSTTFAPMLTLCSNLWPICRAVTVAAPFADPHGRRGDDAPQIAVGATSSRTLQGCRAKEDERRLRIIIRGATTRSESESSSYL
ncbi:hypothetical protein GW17_00055143, partial [Ensete ventricosum]